MMREERDMIETQVTTWALDRLPASCAGAARGGVVATVGRRIATLSSMPREFQTIPGPADDEDEEEDEDEDAGGGGGNIEPDDDEGYDDEDDDDDEEPWQ